MYRFGIVTSLLLLLVGSSISTISSTQVLASTRVSAAGKACVTLPRIVQGSNGKGQRCHKVAPHPANPDPISQYGTLWSAAVDPAGHIFVLDRATARLLKLSPSGRVLGRWSIPPYPIPNQPSDLTGITIGPHHTLYLTDSYNYQLVTVTTSGQIIASWDTHHVRQWRPVGPFGVAVDARGNLYVPNFAFSDVARYAPSGKLLQTFGHPCPQAPGGDTTAGPCTDEGHQGPGELNHPDGIALDQNGNIYVSDHRSRRIVKFAPNGQQLAVFGPSLPAPYGSFGLTEGVAVDRAGNIYVEDRSGPPVVKLSPAGVPLAQWQAPKGYAPEGTPGIDAAGNLYLTLNADTAPCLVVKLSAELRVQSSWK